eukprot:5365450-Prymnesium_polylepis.1
MSANSSTVVIFALLKHHFQGRTQARAWWRTSARRRELRCSAMRVGDLVEWSGDASRHVNEPEAY